MRDSSIRAQALTSPTQSALKAGSMDELEEHLLRQLAGDGQLTAEELARRVGARHWVDLSAALAQLTVKGYGAVVGPLGRSTTRFRAHPQGLAALGRAS
jgi:hypothetical protein